MKMKSKVEATKEESKWMKQIIRVDCREFVFEIPKHLAKTYPIGREVEIEVKPK